MRTGSPALWAVGDQYGGVVPVPPDAHLALMFAGWWTVPRTFGCATARTSPVWNVVLPDPRVLCPRCAVEAYQTERRCAYCGREVRLSKAVSLLFEMGDRIRILGRAHRHCSEQARGVER